MPEPPQLAPLDVEEQRLYSELLPGDRAPHPISKGAPHHPVEETHFGRLYPFFFCFFLVLQIYLSCSPVDVCVMKKQAYQYKNRRVKHSRPVFNVLTYEYLRMRHFLLSHKVAPGVPSSYFSSCPCVCLCVVMRTSLCAPGKPG